MSDTIRVLVVDDSPTARRFMVQTINRTADMVVVGEATNGREGVQKASKLRPSVILMDLMMPEMDGLEATREIMSSHPTPIVIVSASLENYETNIAFTAVQAGALAVLQKVNGSNAAEVDTLLSTVRTMAGVRVIHHWKRSPRPETPIESPAIQPLEEREFDLVAIGASTGGPAALGEIFSRLPATFRPPIVVVQHIAPDFVPSLATWLQSLTSLRVEIAAAETAPQPGSIYLAPGEWHLRLNRLGLFQLSQTPQNVPHIPSVNVLFESVADVYGARAIGVLLTGMGSDGAQGMKKMAEAGAYTLAQDEATSVVFGMPREAAALGAVRQVLPLTSIPTSLTALTHIGALK